MKEYDARGLVTWLLELPLPSKIELLNRFDIKFDHSKTDKELLSFLILKVRNTPNFDKLYTEYQNET